MNSIKLTSSLRPSVACLVVFASVLLVGCADRVSEAESKMAQIRSEPAIPIQDPPKPEPVEDFVYNASDVRSPFLPSSLLTKQNQLAKNEGIKPDLTRKKEPLEKYELSELTYRGQIVSPDGKIHGLVQLPSGLIEGVTVGNYMGANDGRVVEITPTQINLIEILPDNRGGFMEKPASLVSPLN